ncbi:hypothetical protein PMZ80_007337 [Knufia obscura]|uniref:Uncharacterized protein n=2 Tax=Knufia TaxID=430999 RepID=A0AAN8F3M2_9EURO|nr:hypothetical protein PMZ80_007337 [Knufia obscura]KAK5950576.1 hypothetical protein OHC33_008519 [Knufia fluminis]
MSSSQDLGFQPTPPTLAEQLFCLLQLRSTETLLNRSIAPKIQKLFAHPEDHRSAALARIDTLHKRIEKSVVEPTESILSSEYRAKLSSTEGLEADQLGKAILRTAEEYLVELAVLEGSLGGGAGRRGRRTASRDSGYGSREGSLSERFASVSEMSEERKSRLGSSSYRVRLAEGWRMMKESLSF